MDEFLRWDRGWRWGGRAFGLCGVPIGTRLLRYFLGTSVPGFHIPPLRGLRIIAHDSVVAESGLPQGLKPAYPELDSARLKAVPFPFLLIWIIQRGFSIPGC